MDSQKKYSRTFSFEFFPPRNDEGRLKLRETVQQLAQLKPKFFSVTFGAGGSTREGTYDTVKEIQAMGQQAAPHISCIGTTRADVRALLDGYRRLGIGHLVTLRGDPPKDVPKTGDFSYANDLVAFIRAETGDEFTIDVAAYPEFHPESPSAEADIRHFINKVRAGADSAITQYFFNVDAYSRFVEECEGHGLNVPIVPGIMPITNYKQLARFSDACGAEIPRWIRRRLEGFGDDLDAIRTFGLDVTTELCDRLLTAGAPGLHFYTLNRAGPTCTIWERLGI
ncbi:MAG TPA: methylenetetrahydrofolate reductase [NAD(P)H] [Candidatus Methylomirabilis sp.]|nr:methylenetetrahydrofolate reductase [NAD(P)H] [Candidatus Methylomirabilis sp.]